MPTIGEIVAAEHRKQHPGQRPDRDWIATTMRPFPFWVPRFEVGPLRVWSVIEWSARGVRTSIIAERLHLSESTIRLWRQRLRASRPPRRKRR